MKEVNVRTASTIIEIPSAHQTFTLFDLIRELQLYLASWDLEMIKFDETIFYLM
jgi:hypothetical protein